MSLLPETFSFEYLSQLPSNQFEIYYKKFQPLNPPQNGVFTGAQENTFQISLSLAPNEYAIMQDAYLNVDARVTLDYAANNGANYAGKLANPTIGTPVISLEYPGVLQTLFGDKSQGRPTPSNESGVDGGYNCGPRWRYGPSVIGRSSESVNNGSLKLHQNTDSTLCNIYNVQRCQNARRAYHIDKDAIEDLSGAGCDASTNAHGFCIEYTSGSGGVINPAVIKTAPKNFKIPLGLVSDLANCTSLVPVGMFNSYATQSWRLDVTLPRLTDNSTRGIVFPGPETDDLMPAGLKAAPNIVVREGDGYRNVAVWIPVVRVLNGQYQEMVLSQYEKRATTMLNGVTLPVSLRLNTLAFQRYGPYPLSSGQAKHYFRLSTTQPSVRGVSWMVYDRTKFDKHFTDSGVDILADGATRAYKNFASGQLRVTSLETRVGTRCLHDAVRDEEFWDTNVADFVALQERRSAGLMSPFPYWEEAVKQDSKQSDKRRSLQWGIPQTVGAYGCYNLQSGFVSFENSDHRDMTYSSAKQATGINCSQVGAIEINMGFSTCNYTQGQSGIFEPKLFAGPQNGNYEIVFQVVADEVVEVAPTGLSIITQEVMSF
jgi:hypothetical protein